MIRNEIKIRHGPIMIRHAEVENDESWKTYEFIIFHHFYINTVELNKKQS